MMSNFHGRDPSREFFPQECTVTTPNPFSYEMGLYARRFHLLFRAANGSWRRTAKAIKTISLSFAVGERNHSSQSINRSVNQSFLKTGFEQAGYRWNRSLKTMAFPLDPGRPPREIRPLEMQVPDQGNVGARAMLPLVPARNNRIMMFCNMRVSGMNNMITM